MAFEAVSRMHTGQVGLQRSPTLWDLVPDMQEGCGVPTHIPSRYAARSSVCWRWRSGSMVPSGEPLIRVRRKSSPCRLLLRPVCVLFSGTFVCDHSKRGVHWTRNTNQTKCTRFFACQPLFFSRKTDILLIVDFLRPGSALDQPNLECILCAWIRRTRVVKFCRSSQR